MTWNDPEVGKGYFETDDVPTQGNLSTYIFDNLLSVPHVLTSLPANVTVSNTTTETSFFSVLVPGGSLGTSGTIDVTLIGSALFNNSAGDTTRIRVKFGGTTVLDDTEGIGNQTSAVRQGRCWRIFLANEGSTSAQIIAAGLVSTLSAAAPTTGTGDIQQSAPGLGLSNTAAINTSVDQTLEMTVQHSSASANRDYVRQFAIAYLAKN